MNCNLCFKLVRSLYYTHLWSGWCSQLLVNNLRLVWIQKHYTKGYTKNRVQDLIFVPYHLQKPDEWDRRKQLSSFYLSYQCGISRSFWKPINVRNIGIAHQIDVVFYKRLWPHLFIITLSLDLHVIFWLLFLNCFRVLIPVLRLCGISLYHQLLNSLREYFLFSYA